MFVLDKGNIDLEEIAGGDFAVIQAARLCWQTEGDDLGDRDARLIKMLMEKGHGTPFEHAVMRWHVRCPIFVARQWIRHRIGTFNERSLRYTKADWVYYVPRGMSENALVNYRECCDHSFDTYNFLLKEGVPKEQARGVLPLATYTEFIWTVNARSFMNWLTQRLAPGAQYEHRAYAHAALSVWEDYMPLTAGAFKAYCLSPDTQLSHLIQSAKDD